MNNNTYQYKNLTIVIKHEYGQNKRLSDIINTLIIQEMSKNKSRVA